MARLQKSIFKQDLAKYRVYVEDKVENSEYFRLAEVPDVLTGGKNAFLINGSDFLRKTTEVLVEIIDANGNTIFQVPIRDYSEGLARVVSIEVYEDTPRGTATMTILGELLCTSDAVAVPDEWKGKYNVKYTRNFLVEPTYPNNNKVRFYATPGMSVKEKLIRYRESSDMGIVTIESASSLAGTIPFDAYAQHAVYLADTSSFQFTSNMIGGQFTASIESRTTPLGSDTYEVMIMTSLIRNVLSSRVMILQDSWRSLWTELGMGPMARRWETSEWTLKYPSGSVITESPVQRSFAEIDLSNLTTFSGDVARSKVYMKSIDNAGSYEQIADIVLEKSELTLTHSADLSEPASIQTGHILNQTFADKYWIGDSMQSSSYYGSY